MIADDHQLFRKGISAVLNNRCDCSIVGEAASGEEIIELARQQAFDVLLMDLHLPQLNGIAATRAIIQELPQARILGLSNVTREEEVLDLIKAGAKGYVLKETTIDELVLAIKALAGGNSYFSHKVSQQLLTRLHSPQHLSDQNGRPGRPALTGREMEILKYITEELTNKEIASRLFISPRTVETHRRNLIQKLKVKNTVGLVKYYLRRMPNLSMPY